VKPVPIAGAQLCPWETRRELSQSVRNLVGSVMSPLLANIYLHELDGFVESLIQSYTQGHDRRGNQETRTYRIA
jgi:hypothetical protein